MNKSRELLTNLAIKTLSLSQKYPSSLESVQMQNATRQLWRCLSKLKSKELYAAKFLYGYFYLQFSGLDTYYCIPSSEVLQSCENGLWIVEMNNTGDYTYVK